eukprot:TRINITY_DN76554_c0_g1_i1.p1 TRINITY_DN76554_c0_g1~~TRINITY_DN76554_c0_g1_i1.p1  ORF type:complete len:619 (-),score=171.57 TRINITY_DN76554_c0_g1_i1:47-1903(-)
MPNPFGHLAGEKTEGEDEEDVSDTERDLIDLTSFPPPKPKEAPKLKEQKASSNEGAVLNGVDTIQAKVLDFTGFGLSCQVLEKIAVCLVGNESLHTLGLRGNKIRDRGTTALCNAMNKSRALTSVDMSSNQILDPGALAFSKALKENRLLRSLKLVSNGINEMGAEGIARVLMEGGCPSLKVLDLSCNWCGEQAGLMLAKLVENEKEDADPEPRTPDNSPFAKKRKEINRCTLSELCLRDTHLGPKACGALAKAIRSLNCKLEHLDVSFLEMGPRVGAKVLEAIAENDTLTSLDIVGNNIGERGAIALAAVLAASEIRLEALNCASNAMGSTGAQAIAEGIEVNETMLELDISDNQIGDIGMQAFAQSIVNGELLLTKLDLSMNNISKEGAVEFARCLSKSRERQAPELQKVLFRDNHCGDEGAKAFASALKRNDNLEYLDLKNNDISAEGAIWLAEAIEKNDSLEFLGLKCNNIGDYGVAAIAQGLKSNDCLEALDLMANGIGKHGALALSKALAVNRSLETLDLMSNDVGEAGALALSSAIEEYGSLTSLDLMGNSIRTNGAAALTEAIEANDALAELNLSQNLYKRQEKTRAELDDRMDQASKRNIALGAKVSVI